MKGFGCSYYPEMWDPELWVRDLKQMKELGIQLVRIGEFAWGKFEPAEGEFRFDGYLHILDLFHSFGIQEIITDYSSFANAAFLRMRDIYAHPERILSLDFSDLVQFRIRTVNFMQP